jgi:cytochrome c oxidase subunit 4
MEHHAQLDADHQTHVDWKTYRWVALILLMFTILEIWLYYIPSFAQSRLFVPTILGIGVVKFAIVVMFYMHLKYDYKLFRALFVGPLTVAIAILISLLFLFGKLSIHTAG